MTLRNGGLIRVFGAGALALGLAGLAACNKSDKPAPPDVIAEVGGANVTASELDREFTLAGVPADKRGEEQVRTALRELVARKYLASKGAEALLDRDPTVAGDLQRTRDQILAAAMQQRALKDLTSAIKPAEIDAYVGAHPRQFDKHVVYAVDQILAPPIGDPSQYAALVNGAKSLEELEPKLDAAHVPRSRSRTEIDGGAITEAFAQALAGQAPDAVYFARVDQGGMFFKVLSVTPRPVTGAQASALATQAIQGDLLAKMRDADGAAAVGAAKFMGDYARIMTGLKP